MNHNFSAVKRITVGPPRAGTIRSRYGDITTGQQAKHGFADIKTLHALIADPADPSFAGTEFILYGSTLGREQVEQAKALFLRYSQDQEVGTTPFGTVLRRKDTRTAARIYVNGLRVAEEENFLFSYDITSPTKALRRALNRERSNVGRAAYTDRVKAILLACEDDDVIAALVGDLQHYERGTQHDETQWLDVGLHACKQLNARRKVIFLTPIELAFARDFVQRAMDDGYETVIVPENIRRKLPGLRDAAGNPIRDLGQYRDEWQESFHFEFIDPTNLSSAERAVWDTLQAIFVVRGGRPKRVKDVRISATMRLMEGRYQEAVGLWEPEAGVIIVKRDQLSSTDRFAGTILHETSHALSGAPDVSLEFEQQLTLELGHVAALLLK